MSRAEDHANQTAIVRYDENGLTIRERFAMAAMQGILSDSRAIEVSGMRIPSAAVAYADLLIAELAKEPRHE